MSGKKGKVKKLKKDHLDEEGAEKEEEIIEKDPELNAIQEQIHKLVEEETEKISQIQADSNKKRLPLYKERNKICAKIHNFWLETLLKHPDLSCLLTEQDQQVMKHLKDVEVEEFENKSTKSGFRITFTFEENEWFENTTLWKEFINEDSKISTSVSEIKWREGKDYTKTCSDAQSLKPGKKRKQEQSSFFTLFKADEEDDLDDEFWDLIRGDLWPNAIEIYYNPMLMKDEKDDDDEENEEEDPEGLREENEEAPQGDDDEAEEAPEE